MFSTLDNAVTLVHAGGATDIGQWPRILLALSGLAAGFIFDIKNRKYMGIVMYCIMVLSTICVAILKFAGPFMAGLIVFYLSAGFFAVFFTSGFMEISRHMRIPELWAGMGRAVNNIAAAVIANFVLTLLSSDSNLAVIILVLVLFVTVSVVAVIYTFQKKTFMEQLITNAADVVDEKERLRKFSEVFSFTERESEVFNRLVNTEDSIQMIAEKLYVSRRTLERHISAIYENPVWDCSTFTTNDLLMSAFIEPPSGNRGRIFYAFFDKNHLFALILKNGGTPPPHVDRLAELPYILFSLFFP